ncbi:MAG: hypothetical protein K8T25_22710 [Planctomycetia bacterium]|nr:hypothetical protein [Planctomycetia bacterium]
MPRSSQQFPGRTAPGALSSAKEIVHQPDNLSHRMNPDATSRPSRPSYRPQFRLRTIFIITACLAGFFALNLVVRNYDGGIGERLGRGFPFPYQGNWIIDSPNVGGIYNFTQFPAQVGLPEIQSWVGLVADVVTAIVVAAVCWPLCVLLRTVWCAFWRRDSAEQPRVPARNWLAAGMTLFGASIGLIISVVILWYFTYHRIMVISINPLFAAKYVFDCGTDTIVREISIPLLLTAACVAGLIAAISWLRQGKRRATATIVMLVFFLLAFCVDTFAPNSAHSFADAVGVYLGTAHR